MESHCGSEMLSACMYKAKSNVISCSLYYINCGNYYTGVDPWQDPTDLEGMSWIGCV